MKTIVKFTEKEIVREVEKEIELPAYFSHSPTYAPSKANQYDGFFSAIVKITDTECRAKCIAHDGCGGVQFGSSPWENGEVLQNFTQVDKSEWDAAVALLQKEIGGGE